jgi:two-component sensor histidine kinase
MSGADVESARTIFVVAVLDELAVGNTELVGEDLVHARRLAMSWRLLADLCFADLLMLVPVAGEEAHRFVVVAQVRPTTGQTLYPTDMIGTVVDEVERPLLARAWRGGDIIEGDATVIAANERIRVQCIPVRHHGSMVAVVTRETPTTMGRRLGELERVYLDAFERLSSMVADGAFPFAREELAPAEGPTVGDGAIVLDADAKIVFASPNAVSSLHRMGIHAYTTGLHLAELGFEDAAVTTALRARAPVTEEMERGDVSLLMRAIPLLEGKEPVGALLLMRDVTELRRRDRMLMSKDATIREIHHRVKNNLQTIAALLRLQGRRLQSPEAQQALEESERRIRSIAIVHETLSRDATDVVPFDEIVRPLVRVVEESVRTPERWLHFAVEGDAGNLPGEVATPLAVVLNELMQNAVDHAFPRDGEIRESGHVLVRLVRTIDELRIDVVDDGVGLPASFSLEQSKGLGLSIVQALVTGELTGSMEMRNGEPGTWVHVRVPIAF